MINFGLRRAAEESELSLVRGSKLPMQVKKGFDPDQVEISRKETRRPRPTFL